MIFLNKTCFNGLFRINRKGLFNVPMGAYKNPLICDESNLYAVSKRLQNVTIICGDYSESLDFIDSNTFVYLDPPYRPITETSNFTAYTEDLFNDYKQIELARFVDKINKKGAKVVISNSDPKTRMLMITFLIISILHIELRGLKLSVRLIVTAKQEAKSKSFSYPIFRRNL